MTRFVQHDPAPTAPVPNALVFPLLAVLVAVKHVTAGWAPDGFLTTGLLSDADSWVRAQRVLDLWQGAGWFEDTIARLNPPSGLSIHWTRPLDVLILLPAQVLRDVFGLAPKDAVLLAGAWISPVLHACCAATAVWAARGVWAGIGPLLAGLLVVGNPVVGGYSVIGRADHHTLILLFALMALGAAVRAVARPTDRKAAWWAGASAGAGVWVSPEALLVAMPVLAGFGVVWIGEGARGFPAAGTAAQGLRASLGFALVVAVAVALEQRPSDWLGGEYDKVSAQHVLMGALSAAVFATATRVCGAAACRAAAGSVAAASAMGALLALRPNALRGSMAGSDTVVADVFMPTIVEMQPIPLTLASLLGETPALLGAAPAALLVLAFAVPAWRHEGRLAAAVPLGLAFAAALPAALLHRRLALDLAAPACLLAAGLPGLALSLRRPALRRAAACLAIAAVVGTPFLGLFGAAEAGKGAGVPRAGLEDECGIAALEARSRGQRASATEHRPGVEPVLLSNSLDSGPELAWRTPFRVLPAPYHRGGDALTDSVVFFSTTDEAEARTIATRRQASMVLVCAPLPGEPGDAVLVSRLRRGEPPEWLRPVPLPGAPPGVLLFAVQPPGTTVAAPGN